MRAIDFTTALGRLLTDPPLREAFGRDPREVAARLRVRPQDLDAFVGLDPAAIEEQAEGLVDKRFHEVARLLPETIRRLGERAKPLFREHAARYWPTGHRRHVIDAVEFCRFLEVSLAGSVYPAEHNWWRFVLQGRRWSIHLVPDLMVKSKPRRAIQFLFRRKRNQPRQLCLFLNSRLMHPLRKPRVLT